MILETVLSPAEIEQGNASGRFRGATCVVFDVLRATTTIITAIASGVREVTPVRRIEEALALRGDDPAILLAGERRGDPIDGFDFGNSPLEFTGEKVGDTLIGRRLATTTTNGTAALVACAQADRVLACALTNVSAVADLILAECPARVVLVCAGTGDTFALEDGYAAGVLAGILVRVTTAAASACCGDTDDATRAAMAIAERFGDEADADLRAIRSSRNGTALVRAGREPDVIYCAERDRTRVVPVLSGGRLCAWMPREGAPLPARE